MSGTVLVVLALTAFVSVVEGREHEFEALAAALWAETHAREIGVHRYEYVRRPHPGSYLALMLFDDYEGFITHQASRHHIELTGRMRDLITDIEVEFGDPVSGAFGRPDDVAPAAPGEPAQQRGDVEPAAPDAREQYSLRYPPPDIAWWQ